MGARAIVLTGYGINCDAETAYAFRAAGGKASIVHVNDVIADPRLLEAHNILVFPGGFSYGDDTGSGNALANRIRNNCWDSILQFVCRDTLVLGVCNGFQVLVNLGLLPGFSAQYGEREIALVHNDSACYLDRWVDVRCDSQSPWLAGIRALSLPIAHGEGKVYCTAATLARLKAGKQVACTYVSGEMCAYQSLPANPNGSLENIAGITDASGRIFGLMPHPERAIDFTHLPNWTLLREQYARHGKELPKQGPGLQVFRNAVAYFAEK